MGKRLRLQRRGRGTGMFRSTHRAVAKVGYKSLDEKQVKGKIKAQVVDLVMKEAEVSEAEMGFEELMTKANANRQ